MLTKRSAASGYENEFMPQEAASKMKSQFHCSLHFLEHYQYNYVFYFLNFLCFNFSDYVAIGPRFSNTVLQALLVLLKKKLRKVCGQFFSYTDSN